MKQIVVNNVITDYFINENGDIFNKEGNKLHYSLSNSGYYRVTLYIKHKRITFSVHKLMAMTFIRSDFEGYVINHKNGNKLDNRLENIEIGFQKRKF